MNERPIAAESNDVSYVEDFVRVRDDAAFLHGWRHNVSDFWCYVTPPGHASRAQGWKIHVSATPRSAVAVLSAVSRVLLAHRVAFKFAKGLAELRSLLSVRCSRGAGGKFITIYPSDDDQFRFLLNALDDATEGAEGPVILSDRQYRPGSVVHYRYGGFSGKHHLRRTLIAEHPPQPHRVRLDRATRGLRSPIAPQPRRELVH